MTTRGVIDFHTHAFPDALAARAIPALEAEAPDVKAFHDGRLSSLLRSMDEAGIGRSVICSIATRPEQFDPILRWSSSIASERIIPFPSLHPSDGDFQQRVRRIAGEGFRGVKFHPYYQDFYLDEERMLPIYEALMRHDLIIVMHTGFDIAFERIWRCDPQRVLNVYDRFPGIKLVTTHLGAWEHWDEVQRLLLGRNIYMELSFSVESLGGRLKDFIEAHPEGYVLFGSDSPWTGQRQTLEAVRGLGLRTETLQGVLYDNAAGLLGL